MIPHETTGDMCRRVQVSKSVSGMPRPAANRPTLKSEEVLTVICESCFESFTSRTEPELCEVCTANLIAYTDGEYDNEDDPAVKYLHRTMASIDQPKRSTWADWILIVLTSVGPAAVFVLAIYGVAQLIG